MTTTERPECVVCGWATRVWIQGVPCHANCAPRKKYAMTFAELEAEVEAMFFELAEVREERLDAHYDAVAATSMSFMSVSEFERTASIIN